MYVRSAHQAAIVSRVISHPLANNALQADGSTLPEEVTFQNPPDPYPGGSLQRKRFCLALDDVYVYGVG